MTLPIPEDPSSKQSVKHFQSTRFKLWLHGLQVVVSLLTIILLIPVIIIQNQAQGWSAAAVNYVMFVAAFTSIIPVCLAFFPWLYESKNRLKRIGKFFMKPRTILIFSSFYAVLWMTAGIAMTVQALNPSSCAQDKGSAWISQCRLGYVTMGTAWLNCVLWLISLVVGLIVFFQQKRLTHKKLKKQQTQEHHHVLETEVIEPLVTTPPATVEEEEYYQETYPPVAHTMTHAYPQPTATPDYPSFSTPMQQVSYNPSSTPHHGTPPLHAPTTQHPAYLVQPLASMPDPQHYR
ncbi:hypothetical protein DM01DRAFT_1411418 [Hesseltinella vesiculosa]|uniref:MARVEL domain-containing protein n=1 Tax=Hesseltinella vesiculosa TaxID=101127 RepID=A0A1X2G3X5_9FUNG|nr:hypothetical protein DM01DRAFT_1411418 [Hesseltinella vesiculosa]